MKGSYFIFGFACAVILIMGADILLGYNHPDKYWHNKAIDYRCGQYNPQNGEFEWLDVTITGGHDE